MSRRPVVLAVALCLVATACGDDGAGPTPSSTTTTTGVESTAPTDVEVATINLLHGIPPPVTGCVEASDFCRAPARIDILWDLLDTQAGCPEIVALQEIGPRQKELVPEKLGELCDGDHVLLFENVEESLDQEMILTTLPVLDERRIGLAGSPVWSAHWAQLETESGLVVDVFTSHYASSSLSPPCDPAAEVTTCGETCPVDSHLGDCHPFETLAFLEANAAPGSLQLVIGDLNEEIDHPRIQTLIGAGFVDTHLAAGNPECQEGSNVGCSSGIGGDTDLDGLDLAEQTMGSRIDFVLARPPDGCELVVDVDDADGDGTRTGLWANEPLPEPVEGLYWVADHAGVEADLGVDCG